MGRELYELLFCCLLSFVLESRNLKMKAVLLLFAMIVVAFGQEADEGWEETPPADPPVEENKYKTDKYGKKPYGYKPKYDHKPKYGYQPPKPYGYQPPKPYGGYGSKKPMVTKLQAMAKNPMVTKRQLTVGTTTTDTSQPMGKIHMVTKSQLTADTITTDTSRLMATIPTVTKSRCMADTKSMVMVILTDTKNPTERSTTPATLIIPSKKSVNMLMLK